MKQKILSLSLVFFLTACGGGSDNGPNLLDRLNRTPQPSPAQPPASAPQPVMPGASAPQPMPSVPIGPPPGAGQPVQPGVGMQVINGIRVPPDPGQANNQTLLGIDLDRNGIRDDIDRFIAMNFSNLPEKMKAAQILGRLNFANFNKQPPRNQVEAQSLIRLRFKNYECLKKEVANEALRDELFELFESLYLNTEERNAFENNISRLAGGLAISIEFDSSKWCVEGIK